MSDALTELSKAETALAKASDIVQMKQLRDQAAALAVLAEAQGFEHAAQQAKIFQLKAERKAGDWLGKHGPKPGNPQLSHDATIGKALPPLPELGISRDQSSRWQLEASVPEPVFHQWIGEQVDSGAEVTSRGLQNVAKGLGGGPTEQAKATHACPICGKVHTIEGGEGAEFRQNEIRKIAELAFREVRPIDWPANGKELGKRFFQPLRRMCEMAKWNPEKVVVLIWETDQEMGKHGWSVSAPDSMLKTANNLLGEFRKGKRKPNPSLEMKARSFLEQHLPRS